jgi:imidazolonepropionase-like amidohydrolase
MSLLIHGATIIDGTSQAPFAGSVLVDGERIREIVPDGGFKPAADATFDASGMFVMPGLVDAHVHVGTNRVDSGAANDWHMNEHLSLVAFRAQATLREFLELGITTVRNAGSRQHLDVAVRDAEREGLADISRVYAAGSVITQPGEHLHNVGRPVKDADDMRAAVRDEIALGVDLIKVAASGPFTRPGALFTEEQLREIASIAHGEGRTVAAHAETPESIRASVAAGVDSIEHASWLTVELAELMAEAKTCFVPTYVRLKYRADTPPGWRFSDQQKAAAKQAYGPYVEGLARAVELGLPLAIGTDTYGTVLDELEALDELGIPRQVLLQAATRGGAEVLGRGADFGTISAGKRADLLVLRQNPLNGMAALRSPVHIMKSGRLVGVV